MVYQKNNTTNYFEAGKDVVGFVEDQLRYSEFDYPLTMTIIPEKSGGYCVRIVTDMLWEDLEEQKARFFSDTQVNT